MARIIKLLMFLCVCTPAANAGPEDDHAQAVHKALLKGKEDVFSRNFLDAITALESQLPYIDGNHEYRATVCEAYRGYVSDLRLSKKDAKAQVYLRWLVILDPLAARDPRLADPFGLETDLSKVPTVCQTKPDCHPPSGPKSLQAQR